MHIIPYGKNNSCIENIRKYTHKVYNIYSHNCYELLIIYMRICVQIIKLLNYFKIIQSNSKNINSRKVLI